MDVDCIVPQLCCRQRHWNNKACSSCDVLVVRWEIITSAKKVCDRCCLSVIRRSFCLGNFWKFISISRTIPWQDVCLSIRPSVCHTPVLCLNGYTYPQTYRRVAHNSSFSTPNAMAIFWRGSVGKFLESRLCTHECHQNYHPKNGGHFERRAAIGRRNAPHQSYVSVSIIINLLA